MANEVKLKQHDQLMIRVLEIFAEQGGMMGGGAIISNESRHEDPSIFFDKLDSGRAREIRFTSGLEWP